jgi:hypothetical protein
MSEVKKGKEKEKTDMRYRLITDREHTLLLKDDGYRIWYKYLEGPCEFTDDQYNPRSYWVLWAEYKHSPHTKPVVLIADALMIGAQKR